MTLTFFNIPPKPINGKRYAVVSDIHLGHSRVPSAWIIDSLEKGLLQTEVLKTLDAIFITGDTFDKLLNLPSNPIPVITRFCNKLLKACRDYKIALRILEGTPGHDWKQSKIIEDYNEIFEIGADVKYMDGLQIDEDKSLGLTIAYVQDEQSESVEQTTFEMEELLATRGYSQVDFILMHGQFDFQVPAGVHGTFDSKKWSKWASKAIFIGHNHTHRYSKNIYVPGSYERLAHNEEGPKGYLLYDLTDEGSKVHFIENVGSMPFITIDGSSLEDVEIVKLAKESLNKLKNDSDKNYTGFLKIKYPEAIDLSAFIKEWKEKYPTINIDSERIKPKSMAEIIDEGSDEWSMDETLNINKENIDGMIIRETEIEESDIPVFQKEIDYIKSIMKIKE